MCTGVMVKFGKIKCLALRKCVLGVTLVIEAISYSIQQAYALISNLVVTLVTLAISLGSCKSVNDLLLCLVS